MANETNGKKVTIYIMDNEIEEIEKVREEYGLSFSGAIRFIIRMFMKGK